MVVQREIILSLLAHPELSEHRQVLNRYLSVYPAKLEFDIRCAFDSCERSASEHDFADKVAQNRVASREDVEVDIVQWRPYNEEVGYGRV